MRSLPFFLLLALAVALTSGAAGDPRLEIPRVDAERKKAGVPPLRSNDRLDQAAQRHAQDMLARHYFAHESPEGQTVRERARAAGYDWRAVGENIAEGQLSVDEVMDTWMHTR